MKHVLKNLGLFKLGWLACVMSAAAGQPGFGAIAVAAVVAIHLAGTAVPVKEALLLLAAALIGIAWESVLVAAGLVSYPATGSAGWLAPYWIVAMWVLFATTVNHGLAWVKRNWMVAAIAGLLGGPAAFFGGARLGAVEFSEPVLALAVIGAGWAILLPVLVFIADSLIDSALLESSNSQRRAGGPDPIADHGLQSHG